MTTFNELSKKTAATIIGTLLVSLLLSGFAAIYSTTIGNKVEQKEFDKFKYSVDYGFKSHESCLDEVDKRQEKQEKEIESIKKLNNSINENFILIIYRLDRIEKKVDK